MITIRDLAVSYPGREVFQGVDVTLNGGEFTGLLGPNGAGKTTLMRAMLGLVPADAGTVETTDSRPIRDVVGYVCLLYTSPSPRDISGSRMPSSA